MKKVVSVILSAVLLLCAFCACGKTDTPDDGTVKLSFKSASGYEYLKSIDGQKVTINGYLATSSPANGSFIFLMNLPYQSCPFCVPNTSQLSNTIEVYPESGKTFGFTNAAVRVEGTLKVAASESEPFEDDFGYQFNFKIVDASFTVITAEELGEEMKLWQSIAESGLVSDLYSMFDYVNFVVGWPGYWCNSYTDIDGNEVPGYYLYASDALRFLTVDGAQYNYGYVDGYFDNIIKQIDKLDGEKLATLKAVVEKAKSISEKAVAALESGNYTSELQYVEKFKTNDYIYTFPIGDELKPEYEKAYEDFANWLASWEM